MITRFTEFTPILGVNQPANFPAENFRWAEFMFS
jgi:hypothetical protein